jgi:hypothetical protein
MEKISIEEALEASGQTLEDLVFESIVPACCSEGCEVETDGYCEHGHPSVFLELGVL